MDMPDFADPIAIEEIREFKTPPDLEEEAKIILQRHNCQIEEHPEGYLIHFPQGSLNTGRLPYQTAINCTTSTIAAETTAYFTTPLNERG